MAYEGDAFISYAHLDNRVLSDGQTGWVASLQRALETRVAQLAGREAQVWWDPELRGNEDFSNILIERLRKVAALVAVVSPSYINSKWGRRELSEFCRAAEESDGLKFGDQARVFKVLKTLVPLDQHPPSCSRSSATSSTRSIRTRAACAKCRRFSGRRPSRSSCSSSTTSPHDLCRLLEEMHHDRASSLVAGRRRSAASTSVKPRST